MPRFSDSSVRFVGYIGAAANWLIPIATIRNLMEQKPQDVNLLMACVLSAYSFLFVRWSIAIKPANYPLFACHATNVSANIVTIGKYFAFGRQPRQITNA